MNAEVLAVTEIQWCRVRIECRGSEHAVRADDDALDRGQLRQRDVAIDFPQVPPGAHPVGDNLHPRGDAVENMRHLIGKGGGKVACLGVGVSHCGLPRADYRLKDDSPHGQDDQTAENDDPALDSLGPVARIGAEETEQWRPPNLRKAAYWQETIKNPLKRVCMDNGQLMLVTESYARQELLL